MGSGRRGPPRRRSGSNGLLHGAHPVNNFPAMAWSQPNDRTTRSGNYRIVQREDGWFDLLCQHRRLGRFGTLQDGQRAAEAHSAFMDWADEMFARLVGFLNGEAPQ